MNTEQIAKYLTNQLSEQEVREFLTWVHESDENMVLFSRVKNAWAVAAMGETDAAEKEYTMKRWAIVRPQIDPELTSKIRRKILWRRMSVAASLTLLATLTFLGISYLNRERTEEGYQTFKVPAGQRASLMLPDQSVVWLNAESTLRYPEQFSPEKREVILEGEALFDVKHSGAPFLVQTGKATVKVLGTLFNVYAYPFEKVQHVTLVRGSVAVYHTGSKDSSLLAPGYSAAISDAIAVDPVDTTLYTAWTQGTLSFRSLPFSDLALRLERKFGTVIVFLNPSYRELRFNGTFRESESLRQILEVIRSSTHFEYSIKNDTLYIE